MASEVSSQWEQNLLPSLSQFMEFFFSSWKIMLMLFSLPLGATAPKLSQTYGINLINNIFIGCLLHTSHFSKCFANNVIISALGGNRLYITSAFILFMRKLGLTEVKWLSGSYGLKVTQSGLGPLSLSLL